MALKRRKITKAILKAEHKIIDFSTKILECKECSRYVEVGADIGAVTCAICVQKMVGPPDNYVKKKDVEEKRPRGWQFMKQYVSPSGKVYNRGILKDDKKTVEELPVVVPAKKGRKPAKNSGKNSNSKSNPKGTSGKVAKLRRKGRKSK